MKMRGSKVEIGITTYVGERELYSEGKHPYLLLGFIHPVIF